MTDHNVMLPPTNWKERHAALKLQQDKTTMNIAQYQVEAENTKSEQFNVPGDPTLAGMSTLNYSVNHLAQHDVLHAIIGVATEGAELLDPVKKMMFYGKPLDMVNLDEEMGDLLWYIAIYANARKTTIEALATTNNLKLRARYPDKFSSEKALNRDLERERIILEGHEQVTEADETLFARVVRVARAIRSQHDT